MSSGSTTFRTPSYFPLWNQKNHRKHVSSSPKSSPRRPATKTMMNNTEELEGGGGGDNCRPSPSKMRSPRQGADTNSAEAKSSAVAGDSGGTASTVLISPKHKDPDRIKKDREREERVRQARERLEEERKKKLVELQEQQRQAQENREKQLEMRRRKIEDLRRREMERRAEVEKRRRERETAERSRRETLLLKAEERVARYEAWKRGGQKGGRGHVLGFGSATPRDICQPVERPRRSSSHSALVRHSPNGSDSDYSFRPQRRALSACSTVRRHCCVDLNRTALNTIPEGRRSVLAPSAAPPSRHKSVTTLSTSSTGSGVRLRENKAPRKPRPASVGSSMPSFVNVDGGKGVSPRSKSTDRQARDRSRPRGGVPANQAEDKDEEKKTPDKPGLKISRKTLDRLSTPRQVPVGDGDRKDASSTPRREPNLTRKPSLKEKTKETPVKPQTPKDTPVKPQTPKEVTVKIQPPAPKEKPAKPQQQPTSTPSAPSPDTVAPVASSTPRSTSPRPTSPRITSPRTASPASRTPERTLSPPLGADEDGGSNTPQSRSTPTPMEKSTGDITAEEYKAKLAEKRRQAREKAEREAEEERKRKEEEERLEEERRQKEEEEQRLRDEEAMRLAEEARRAEEERLQKAIEAEEARKAEEAARLEQDRLAKEEAERKAKEEADRLEQERQEKARREEEERLERKKRLEMIMKRVKTDNAAEGVKDSPKSVNSSPTKSAASTASSDSSPLDPENKTILVTPAQSAVAAETEERKWSMDSNADESRSPASGTMSPANAPSPVPFAAQDTSAMKISSSQENMLDTKESTPTSSRSQSPVVSALLASRGETSTPDSGAADKPKFKSPLLQKLVEGKDDASPKFKSPLLQNLLSKTRVGARMGLTQDYSRSSPDLSQVDPGTNGPASSASPTMMAMSSSMIDMDTVNSASKEDLNKTEEKDVDTSEDSSSSHSSPSHTSRKTNMSNGEEGGSPAGEVSVSSISTSMETSTIMESSSTAPGIMTTSSTSLWNDQDSGVVVGSDELRSSAASTSLQVSLNGHTPKGISQGGLEDSSISMQSVDSVTSPHTDSATGNVPSCQSSNLEHSSDNKNFEEIIDLSISNTTQSGVTLLGNSDDLVNFNKLEEESEGSPTLPPPIIAFEDSNMMRPQDVSDLMS